MFGLGYDVGQRTAPVAASGGAQRDCTPWMQFVPQSYSGSPSRGTAPAGDSRAVSSGAFSAHASRAIRSSTRACVPRLASQKAKPAVAGVAHPRQLHRRGQLPRDRAREGAREAVRHVAEPRARLHVLTPYPPVRTGTADAERWSGRPRVVCGKGAGVPLGIGSRFRPPVIIAPLRPKAPLGAEIDLSGCRRLTSGYRCRP